MSLHENGRQPALADLDEFTAESLRGMVRWKWSDDRIAGYLGINVVYVRMARTLVPRRDISDYNVGRQRENEELDIAQCRFAKAARKSTDQLLDALSRAGFAGER